jgi:hypothetical protein
MAEWPNIKDREATKPWRKIIVFGVFRHTDSSHERYEKLRIFSSGYTNASG